MSSPAPRRMVTPAEYLAIERDIETRHEYFQGEMFAMGGASREHNLASASIAAELISQLKDRRCEVYIADMRVRVSSSGLYTYPDVVVTCEQPRFEDDHFDTLLNPQTIVEVLSDSTETYDRGRKFAHYRQIESLQDYVLVAQKEPRIELYSRHSQNEWLLREQLGMEGVIELPSIQCTLPLAEVYARFDFSEIKE